MLNGFGANVKIQAERKCLEASGTVLMVPEANDLIWHNVLIKWF